MGKAKNKVVLGSIRLHQKHYKAPQFIDDPQTGIPVVLFH